MRRIESDTSIGSLFGPGPGARNHHIVYDEQTGEIIGIYTHNTEGFKQKNRVARQLRAVANNPVGVGVLDIGEPYRKRGDRTRLTHGVNDPHHPDSNARRIMGRVTTLAKLRAEENIPENRLADNPNVWIA